MVDYIQKECYTLEDFREIIHILRHEGGCPWDQEQTHHSIRRDLLEEAAELAEAIDQESLPGMEEELGDVLLQVVFHADIEADAGHFDLDDVADHAAKKMIFRHPHVFGEAAVSGTDQVLQNWDALKRQEKHQTTYTDTLNAVTRTLPALWRAEKVQKKAAKAGFQWDCMEDAVSKVTEEAQEVQAAVTDQEGRERVAEELGDLLFAAVNVARYAGEDPETLLHAATEKFIRRFAAMEQSAGDVDLQDISSTELVKLWNNAKKGEGHK
ncbi:MAG: nucleoside triphosphate pyrophosphohydrolase [Clostridiales bacterium]|nr:nucleoside triphosphate pyrophosphohydrolase [Clostridiales bacterium]